MGFDTYLQIDDQIVLMWRKHAGPLPRLLFRFADLQVDSDTEADGAAAVRVSFRVSVEDALSNLEHAGLGWQAAVAAYADTRVSGFSAGIAMGRVMSAGDRVDGAAVERELAAFEAIPADQDLSLLGKLMVSHGVTRTARRSCSSAT